MLGPILVTLHNLTFYQRLVAAARAAIVAGEYCSFMDEKMRVWSEAEGRNQRRPLEGRRGGQAFRRKAVGGPPPNCNAWAGEANSQPATGGPPAACCRPC